jgi:hypothetical protein
MKELIDYIKYHGVISNIRDKLDDSYVWIDICQKERFKDKNGMDRTNLSFFSARIYQEYFIKTNLKVGDEIYVIGIPKGYVDKNNLRQNYIHVLELNGIEIKKEPINEYWNGQKVEIRPPTVNELKEFDELLKDFM